MYALLIRFPFSSSNDEQYELVLYSAMPSVQFVDAIIAMTEDTKNFINLGSEVIGSLVVQSFEGTLAGDVISDDNDREDVFVPLVESKLKFNMVCQQFPTWLMDLCDYYTNVKVMLVVKSGGVTIERWRGYLMANTLNMTVVNEMMACPLVAVDEVGIAKYFRFKETFPVNSDGYHPTLFQLFSRWWIMHSTSDASNSRFDTMGSLLNCLTRSTLFVVRDMMYDGIDEHDLLGLTVNLERWFLDRDATWGDVFQDICTYLGVSYYIGSPDSGGNDCYMLSDTDRNFGEYLAYTFGGSYVRTQERLFGDFGNQQKVGADFQANFKPCEWKGVKVTSEPQRPPVHEYLNKDNVKAIAPAVGHQEWCETQIGKYRDATTLDDFKWRVFQYTNIVDKDDQWIPESTYVNMPGCVNNEQTTWLKQQGYLPFDPQYVIGNNKPSSQDVDSMEFALTKRGMITAKIGTYETPREKVSANLKDYFVILNNKWGRLYWDNDNIVPEDFGSEKVIAYFSPFGNDHSIMPDGEFFLSIDFSAIIINENIGDDIRIQGYGPTRPDLHGMIESVFPMIDSAYDWAAGENDIYTGNLTATAHNYIVGSLFQPVIKCRLSIGKHYWNGSTWVYVDGTTAPTFNLRLTPVGATQKYWMVDTGYMHGQVDNYYYEECRPRVGASDNVFRVPLHYLSVHGQPVEGLVFFELIGPIHFVNGYKYTQNGDIHYNNILFVLLSDIKIEFTDDAYYSDKDIRTVAKVETDPTSTTKKIKEVELNMSTPSVDGFFNNCLLYDNGKGWVNLQAVQTSGIAETFPEEIIARERSLVYGGDQVTVEFSREFDGVNTDNIYNVGFTVSGLTEVSGTFMPLTRKFNWTKGWVRWKLQKVAD